MEHEHDDGCGCIDARWLESKQLSYGFVVVYITDAEPPWGYTIGLERAANHPELCVSGLPRSFAGYLLNLLGGWVLDGEVLQPGRQFEGVVTGHLLLLRTVHASSYRSRFGRATEMLGTDEYRMLQALWNDTEGRFPAPSASGSGNQELL